MEPDKPKRVAVFLLLFELVKRVKLPNQVCVFKIAFNFKYLVFFGFRFN